MKPWRTRVQELTVPSETITETLHNTLAGSARRGYSLEGVAVIAKQTMGIDRQTRKLPTEILAFLFTNAL
jgi:hypothetical protein